MIMFASVIGYAFQGTGSEENSNVEYKGFEFISQDSSWILEDKFIFKYNPLETEEFVINNFLNLLIDYQAKPLYIYSENKEAELEIYRNFYSSVQRIQYACLEKSGNDFEVQCEESWPMKNCSNNFILIKEGEFKVEQENNCVFIEGPKENLTKISDEVLFNIIGVKQ